MSMKRIFLFDLDGTLVESGQIISQEMVTSLQLLKDNNWILGIVGGGTITKIRKQLDNHIDLFKYIFSECGAVVYIDNVLYKEKNITDHISDILLYKIKQKALLEFNKLSIKYTGNRIDIRKGLIYVTPVGMDASEEIRKIFKDKNINNVIRDNIIKKLKLADNDSKLQIVNGGECGIAIYPNGWDKTQILDNFNNTDLIVFVGDKTDLGGNDYELYVHPRVIGCSTKSIEQTQEIINDMCQKYK